MPAPLPPIGEIIETRSGEALELNDRYLNRQLGRIVRTLGFDRDWRHGEGAHLIDADGERYLDLLCGYGVFAVGRNHPEVMAALRATLEAQTGSLPQLGVTALPGVLAEQLVQRSPARIEAMVTANSGTESVEAAIKLARATTGRPNPLRRARLPRTHARLAVPERKRGVPRRLRAAPARLQGGPVRERRRAAPRARKRRCRRLHR
jgi:4-aminobutyrate aminotransferase-like enzyme